MALKDFTKSMGKLGSPYEFTPLTFQQLDVEKLKKKLNLKDEAEKRGKKEMPAEAADFLDDIEQGIISLVDSEVKIAVQAFHDDMSTFNTRIGRLGAAGHSTNITGIAASAEGDFEMVVRRDTGLLYIAKQGVSERYKSLIQFKAENNRKTAARYPKTKVLGWSVAAAILTIETIANGSFFAQGSAGGFIAGAIMALAFSFLNVTLGYWLGNYGCRLFIHVSAIKRAVGYFLCAVLPIAMITLNLIVAHYRAVMTEAVENDILNTTKAAFASFASSPLGLVDVDSWFLFCIGCTFAIIATIDFWKMDDAYPNYGQVQRDHDERMDEYALLTEDSLHELMELKDEKLELVSEYNNSLNAKLNEAKAILDAQRRWQILFTSHLTHLEDCGRQLLSFYRSFNISARTTPFPPHFSEQWTLQRPVLSDAGGDLTHIIEEFSAEAAEMKTLHESCLERINTAYRNAVKEYQTIEQLKPEQLKSWAEQHLVVADGLAEAA